jgi:hypothetical protein
VWWCPFRTLHRYATTELGFGQRKATVRVADGELGAEVTTRRRPSAPSVSIPSWPEICPDRPHLRLASFAEVGGHRGAGAADRLCPVCVSVLAEWERVDHDPSTLVEPSRRRTRLLVARNRGENNLSRAEPDAKHG